MNWTMLGAVGELVGAIAVVASLLYVGRQVRHSARLATVEGVESFTALQVEWARSIIEDPELAALVFRVQYGEATRSDFSDAERTRLGYLYWTIHVMQASHFQRFRGGLIERSDYDAFALKSVGLLGVPYHLEVWPFVRESLPVAYREDIERQWPASPASADSALSN